MFTPVAIAAIATLFAILGLLGRPTAGPDRGVWSCYVSTMPIIVASGAATLAIGFSISSAAIAAATVFLAVVLAGAVSPTGWYGVRRRAPASSMTAWLCSVAVVVGLCVFLVDFAAGLVADLTGLRYWPVAMLLVAGGVAAGFGRRAQVGQARVALVVISVVAVLLLAIGAILGSPTYLGTEMIPAGVPGWKENVAYPIALIVAVLAHPGIGPGKGAGAKATVITAVVAGVTVLAFMTGLLMLMGGLIQVPSVELNALVAFMPAPVNALVAVLAAGLGLTVLARSTALIEEGLVKLSPDLPWSQSWAAKRRIVMAIVLFVMWTLLAWLRPAPITTVLSLALVAIIGLAARHWAKRHEAAAPTAPADGAVVSQASSPLA